jgi:glycerophosphoryl diester phosphodiesterase
VPLLRRHIRDHARKTLPTHIPALADLYEALGTSFELSLDVKDPAAFQPILDVAADAGALDRLWLCDDNLERVVGRIPSARSAHMVVSTHLDDLQRVVAGGLREAVARLASAGGSAFNFHGSEWNRERVDLVHGAGLLAFGWDAQSEYHISRLVGLGVDGIYSDHVGRLVGLISQAPTPGTE